MSSTDQNLFPGYDEPRSIAMTAHEMPQARCQDFGPGALSDAELLSLVVGGRAESLDVGRAIIAEAGGISALRSWSAADFQVSGLSEAVAVRMVAVMELARRSIPVDGGEKPVLNRADLIAGYMERITGGADVEKFHVLALNRRNRVLKCVEISTGIATATLAHPREIFRAAIREGACAIVCVHNHPSGDPSPSTADMQLTRQVRDAAATVDISFLDHVICGRKGADPLGRGYYSFREAGLL